MELIDLQPKNPAPGLPRGVEAYREYQIYDHEKALWSKFSEFIYRSSIGMAYLSIGPGKTLKSALDLALRLLLDDHHPNVAETGCYGVANSLKNFDDLFSGSPLSLVVARSGFYTERSVSKNLDVFTGNGRIQPSRLHRLMADRPALTLPYHPFDPLSYKRIKPAYVPPEIKMKYATPFGTEKNEILLAGKIANRWSDDFYQKVREDVNYTLWITEGEKKGMCMTLPSLLLGSPIDVIGIPGVWMWGKKQGDGSWKLAPELSDYIYSKGGQKRSVGIMFDGDSWRNPKVADALLKLCNCLRTAGASVFIGVIPFGTDQKGIDDFFQKHCVKDNSFNFGPLLELLDNAIYVDREYTVNYPSPEVGCRLKTLTERAEEFEGIRLDLLNKPYSSLEPTFISEIVLGIGMFLDPESSDLNGGRYLESFLSLSVEKQADRWAGWLMENPFQGELDHQLDRYIPGVFRGRVALEPVITMKQAVQHTLTPDQLKDINTY